MRNKGGKLLSILLLFVFFATTGFGCKGTSTAVQEKLKPVELNWWTVFTDSTDLQAFATQYSAMHPYVTINIRKFRPAEYERELINALSEDRGPDVFSIHNTWTRGYIPKLEAVPESITLPYQFLTGTLKKELQTELRTVKSMTPAQLKKLYPDVVYQDAIVDNKIYGLPLSMDTMALYYNIDILNNAGIAQAPLTWEDFQSQVIRITKLNGQGNIVQPAAGIGTADNTERAFDLLSLLMLQNGAEMVREGTVFFDRVPSDGFPEPPGRQALSFYTNFANPATETYTFNSTFPNSLDTFINGQTAFFFGYNYQLDDIRARSPRLNFGINPMLQIAGGNPINYANYWLESVSKKSKNADIAWDFVQFITKQETVKPYLDATKRPTALRGLITSQTEDADLGVFVSQLLTSRSWYTGKDIKATENAFKTMINQTLSATLPDDVQRAIETAADTVAQTY